MPAKDGAIKTGASFSPSQQRNGDTDSEDGVVIGSQSSNTDQAEIDEVRNRFKALMFDSQLQNFFIGVIAYSVINLILLVCQHDTSETNNNTILNSDSGKSVVHPIVGKNSILLVIIIVFIASIVSLLILTIVIIVNHQLKLRKPKYLARKEMMAPWLPVTSIGLLLSFVLILWPSIYLNIIVISNKQHKSAPTTTKNYMNLFNDRQSSENSQSLKTILKPVHSNNSALPVNTVSLDNLGILPLWMLNSTIAETFTLNYWPISPLLVSLYMLPMVCQNIRNEMNIIISGMIPVLACLFRLAILYAYKSVSLRTKQQQPLYSKSTSSPSLSTTISGSIVYLPDVLSSAENNSLENGNVITTELSEDCLINQCLADTIVSIVSLLCGMMQRRTLIEEIDHQIFDGTKQLIEAKVNLEHQRQQQETLLLSVLPAYVADQVKRNMVKKMTSAPSHPDVNDTTITDSATIHGSAVNTTASTTVNLNNPAANNTVISNSNQLTASNQSQLRPNPTNFTIGSYANPSSRRGFNELYICTYHNVSLLYADIVGFTRLCTQLTSSQLVIVLNDLFSRFDHLAHEHRILRIKILGDCYYGVCGIPETAVLGSKSRASGHNHAISCVSMGLDMIKVIRFVGATINAEGLNMRIGVHTGHIHSGVIGLKKWQFDVWSNDVSIAMHCESSGIAGRVHCTSATINSINDAFDYEDGDGPSRDSFLARLDIRTYLIIGFKNTNQQQHQPSALNCPTSNKSTIQSSGQSDQPQGRGTANQDRGKSTTSNRIDKILHQQPDYSRPFSAIDHTSIENIRVATMSTINQTLISTNKTFCFENHHDLRATTLTFRDECLERLYERRKIHKLFYFLSLGILISMFIMPIVESLLIDSYDGTMIFLSTIITLVISLFIIVLTFLLDREKCDCDPVSQDHQKYPLIIDDRQKKRVQTEHFDDSKNITSSKSVTSTSKTPILATQTEHEKSGRKINLMKQFETIHEHQSIAGAKTNNKPTNQPSIIEVTANEEQQTTLQNRQHSYRSSHHGQFISIVTVNNPTTGLDVKTSLLGDTLSTMRKSITRSKTFKSLHFHSSKSITFFKIVSIVIILIAVASLNISRIDLSLDLNIDSNIQDVKAPMISDSLDKKGYMTHRSTARYTSENVSAEINQRQISITNEAKPELKHRLQPNDSVREPLDSAHSTNSIIISTHNPVYEGIKKHASSKTTMRRDRSLNQTKYKELTVILMILTIDALNPLSFSIKLALIFIYVVSMTLVPAVTFFTSHTTNFITTPIATGGKLNASLIEVIFVSLCSLSGSNLVEPGERSHLEWSNQVPLGLSLSCLIMIFSIWILLFKRQFEYISRTNFLWRQRLSVDQEELEYISGINKVLLENILPSHVVQYYLDLPKQSVNSNNNHLYHEQHDNVAIMFASIPYFYEFYDESDINKQGLSCIALLNEIICDFDKLLSKNKFSRIEKIKTIGSTYMAASGLRPSTTCTGNRTSVDYTNQQSGGNTYHDHSRMLNLQKTNLICIIHYAFGLMNALNSINKQSFQVFKLRVGISTGSVIAGVVGAQRPFFDIWGDSVNIASRMESLGQVDRIHVADNTAKLLIDNLGDNYLIAERGLIEVKGIGPMKTHFIDRRDTINESRCQSSSPGI